MKETKEKNKLSLTIIITFLIIFIVITGIVCFTLFKKNNEKESNNSKTENTESNLDTQSTNEIQNLESDENTSNNQQEITLSNAKEALIHLCKDNYGEVIDSNLIEKDNFLAYFKPNYNDPFTDETLLYHQWIILYDGEMTKDNEEFYVYSSWECFIYNGEFSDRIGHRAYFAVNKRNGNIIEGNLTEQEDYWDYWADINTKRTSDIEEIIFETTRELNEI